MTERRGTIALILKYRTASLAVVGCFLIVASLLNLVCLIMIRHGSARVPLQFWLILRAIPEEAIGIALLIALSAGVALLLLALLAWAFDG